MASFVEQATLKIDDQSTKQVRAINKELNKLFKTAGRLKSMKFDIGGIKQAQRQVKSLTASLRKLPRQKTINVNINQKGATPPRQRQQRPLAPQRQPAPHIIPSGGRGGRGGVFGASNLSIARAVITSYGAIKIGSAALTAVNDAQAQDTKERSIFRNDQATQNLIMDVAKQAVLATPRIDLTRARGIATDLAVGGVKNQSLPGMTTLFANTESAVGALFPGLEKSVTLFNNKMVNLSNSSDDLARSMELVKGGARGIAAAGESFNADTSIAALRYSNLAPTISSEGLSRFLLIVDAMGQSAGTSINRLRKELFIPANQAGAGSGIAKGAIKNLNAAGMRGFTDDQQRAFGADPVKFINDVLVPRIQKQGVDTNDRGAVDKYLQQAGFNATSQRLMLQAITSADEVNQQLKVVSGIDPNQPNAGAEGNLKLATDDLIKSFNTLSSQVLVPLAETAAPFVTGLASYTEKVALTGSTLDKLQLAASAAAGVFLAYKTGTTLLSQLFNPLNVSATNLTGSATALTSAARALGGSSVAGGVNGAPGGGQTAGLRTSFGWAGIAGGIGLALAEYERSQKYAGMTTDQASATFTADLQATRDQMSSVNDTLKGWMNAVLGKSMSDTIAPGAPVQGPPKPMDADRSASLDAFLAGPTQFEQAFTSGSQTAGTTLEASLTQGAAGVAQTLAAAITNAGNQAAAAMGAAINNAQVRVAAPAGANVGASAPRE